MPEAEDYLALRRDVGAVWLPRDALRVTGRDALEFLQGQLSQDVAALPTGGAALSFLLQPQGKVDALVRVTRLGDDDLLVDVDGGWGEAVIARLQRFKLRVKAEFDALPWRCLALRGPRAHEVSSSGDNRGALALDADWPGLPGIDLLGEDPAVPAGVRVCAIEAYEAVRIEAGVPSMGRELTESTIPGEVGLVDRAVSFTKGCFTGQELVARIDSRGGNVPRNLCGVVVGTNVIPPPGAIVTVGDREVGWLTSVAESLDRGAPVALAFVKRSVTAPVDALIAWDGGQAPGRIEKLPLVA